MAIKIRDANNNYVWMETSESTMPNGEPLHTPVQAAIQTAKVWPTVTSAINAVGQATVIDVSAIGNLVLHCNGTFSGVNAVFEASLDSTNGTNGSWFTVQAVRSNANVIETTTGSLSSSPAYSWSIPVNGYKYFRVRCTARSSGTQNWVIAQAPFTAERIPAIAPSTVTVSNPVTTPAPSATTGAASHSHAISLASTNATVVKASAGTVNDIVVSNNGTSGVYLKLYNMNTAPTVGTSTPIRTIFVPANSTEAINCGTYGLRMTSGISYALTGGIEIANTAAVGLAQVAVNISYT